MNFENGRAPVISAKNGKELYEAMQDILSKGTKDRKNSSIKLPEPRGMAFEGLARESIFCELFTFLGLELYVFSGFLCINGNPVNKQIDLIISYKMPLEWMTSGYHMAEYSDVIAIVEVKTTLTYADLKDAIEHLGYVRLQIINELDTNIVIPDDQKYIVDSIFANLASGSSSVTGTVNPADLDCYENTLYSSALYEAVLPLSFILAFSGYGTEDGFHRAFIRALDENQLGPDLRILPTVICTEKFSINKSLVYPFSAVGNGHFNMTTSDKDPLLSIFSSVTSKIAIENGLRDVNEHIYKDRHPEFKRFVQFMFFEYPTISICYASDLKLIKKSKNPTGLKPAWTYPKEIPSEDLDWLLYSLVKYSGYRGLAVVVDFNSAIIKALGMPSNSSSESIILDDEARYLREISLCLMDYELLVPRHDDLSIEIWGEIIIYECKNSFYIADRRCETPPPDIIKEYRLGIDGDYTFFSSNIFYHEVVNRLYERLNNRITPSCIDHKNYCVGLPFRI